jgi:hypothetical protein
MRALVVYESMSASTRELSEAIAGGLRSSLDVRVVRADEVRSPDAGMAHLLVAGGPARADFRGARSGMGAWFDELGTVPALFAAFDTRSDVPVLLTGAASVRIGRELRRRGSTPVVPPDTFLLTASGGLKAGEPERGRRWGVQIADAARRAQLRRSSA